MTNEPMTTPATSSSPLAERPLPVQAKLAAAWTSFMFLYVYVDVFGFYKPGVVDDIMNGLVWKFTVTPPLLTVMLASVAIPAVMVALSITLPARASRITNLVSASVLVPYSIFNAAGESWEWAGFYALSIGIELLLLAFILRAAWTWHPVPAVPSGPMATGRARGARQ